MCVCEVALVAFALGRRLAAVSVAVALCGAGVTEAQQTLGGVSGTVTDASGGALPEVQVTIVDEGTHLTRSASSNSAGGYAIPNLPIGSYTLTFTRTGFSTAKFPGIVVQADRTVTLPVSMALGSVSESVTVEATPLLNAVDTTNGYVLDRAQIEATPLPTGSFTGLAILSPGVNAELPGGTGANSGLGNAPIWSNGQRDTSNTFLLNGVDASNLFNGKSTSQVESARVVNNTGVGNGGAGGVEQSSASVYLAIGQAIPTPAPEMLAEVRVNASMYDAQQGSTSGAHIDMSTVSGTNTVHGQAYFRRGTDWLNAAPFFFKQDGDIPANEKLPQLHRFTAGGTVGGPIIKDKLFGFVAYQRVHVGDQEIGISRLSVPYGLSNDRSAAALAAVANDNFGTSITPDQVSPVALYLMQAKAANGSYMVPSASGVTPTYSTPDTASIPGTAYFNADQAVGDLDWNAAAKDTVSVKYYYQHDPTLAPFAYSSVPGFTQHLDAGSQVASITNTYTVKSNLSTTEIIGFAREKAYGYNEQPFTAQDAGINTFGSSYFPGVTIIDDLGNSSPHNPGGVYNASLNIGPGSLTQAPFTGLFQNRLMPSANAIWSLGKHTVAFGGNYAYTQLNIRNDRIGKGMISTPDFANFLLGNLSYQNDDFTTTSLMLGNANRYYRANQVGTYVQDKYQVTPTLSLSAGLRWDWNGGLTEKYGRIFNFDPSGYGYDEASGDITSTGFIIAGNNSLYPTRGVSKTTLTGRQWGFGPRLGAAWSPSQFGGKVVVRTGVGIYYDRGELFTYLSPGYAAGEVTGGPFGVTQTPPFVNTVQCNNGINTPSPSVVSPCTGVVSLSNPWGTTPGTPPTGNPADIAKYLPSASAIVNGAQLFSFATYDRANKLPYTTNYTLDVQWQPRNDLAISLGYVGNVGRHEVLPVPFNQAGIASPSNQIHGQSYTYGYAVQNAGSDQPPTNCDGYYGGCSPATLPNGQTYLSTYEGGNIDLRVPYVGFSSESEAFRAAGVSAYNALQAHVEKRMSRSISFGVSYTYSHALDEQSALGLFYNGNNPDNLRGGYASSDFDRTHILTFNYLFQIPDLVSKASFAGKFADGWSLVGLTVLQSGQPYSVIDYSGAVGSIYYGVADGILNPIVPLAPGCTAKSAKTGASGAFGTPALKASCFTLPLLQPGGLGGAIPTNDTFETTFSSGLRNIFRQAAQKRADVSLAKVTTLYDRYTLKYTFDVYNLTNTTSFDIPGDNVSQNEGYVPAPIAGTTLYNAPAGLGITSHTIGSPRQIQMSLRLAF